MINVGIVGLGFMAATHIKAFRQIEGVRIHSLCNPSGRHLDGDFSDVTGNIGSQDAVKVDMKSVNAYRSISEFVGDPEVDAVDICAPTAAHHELCLAALNAGKHVICEKPLARTIERARQIAQAAASARGFFMPAMCMRFWPGWSWLKQAIADGTYGRILSARFRRVAEPPGWGLRNFFNGAESGGGLFDLHIHDTDFVQFCFGRPKSVYSTGYSIFSGAVDHVVTQYEVASGAIVHAEGSWTMSPGYGLSIAYTLNFEQATLEFDLARAPEALRLFQKGSAPQVLDTTGPDGYVGELRHFIESIRSGKPPAVVTAEDAVSAVEICDAEERSVLSGEKIFL